MTHTIYTAALVDNRWEIANYKALTWILERSPQLAAAGLLNDLLNFLRSRSLCKARHSSRGDTKSWTRKPLEMWRRQAGKQKVPFKKAHTCSTCCSDIYPAVHPKAIWPVVVGPECRQTAADILSVAAVYRAAYSITKCRRGGRIMSDGGLGAILPSECDIEVTHNPIMAAI